MNTRKHPIRFFFAMLSLTIYFVDVQARSIPINITDKHYSLKLVTKGIDIPWGMAWLNANDMLVTDKKGELRLIRKGQLLTQKIAGIPKVNAKSQGGLLDVEVDPNYAQNGWIYLSYAGFEGDEKGSHTSIVRGKLKGFEFVESQVIFNGSPNTTKNHHYGSRIEFDKDGYLYFSVGDRGDRGVSPQRLDRDAGKVHRIHADGSIPTDNPFVGQSGANQTVYSYGHRNPQGMAMHPESGRIWTHEHGPKGGDEINLISAGINYGWPVITYGVNYNGSTITDLTHKDGMQQPDWQWTPSIAPSGMTFITSEKYPHWQNKMLVGSLKFLHLVLVDLDGNTVKGDSKVFENIGRVRSVKQGADGYIYVGTDGTGIFRIVPKS